MNFDNGENLSIIISSFLKVNERLDILKRVIVNLRKYFPKSYNHCYKKIQIYSKIFPI